MSLETIQTRDPLASTYLEHLQELALEITTSMEAIVENDLPKLQSATAKQEILCANLATMASVFPYEARTAGSPRTKYSVPPVEMRINAARLAVVQLNRQYAALLKHSGRSIALLAALCRSHSGNLQEACGARVKRQTWSCEM